MTTQADIIAVFSQYVVVDEVVMKGSFCFVNTRGLCFRLHCPFRIPCE